MFHLGAPKLHARPTQYSSYSRVEDSESIRLLTDHRIPQSERWQIATTHTGNQRFAGYAGTLLHAIRVAFEWDKYDVLITADVQHALAYSLMKRLWPCRAPRIMVLETRFDDPLPTLKWKAKRILQQFAFQAVDLICVSARHEIDTYRERLGLETTKFQFVPWHTNILEPKVVPTDSGYVFSAGRTGRDWDTFFDAVRGMPWKVVVVSSKAALHADSVPDNVTLYTDIPYTLYLKLLYDAAVVVVPLESHVYSSGQVAFLEALALGKPLVATEVIGTKDYIEHNENGLLVPPYSPNAIRTAIQHILSDYELTNRMRRQAVESVMKRHTLDAYVSTVIELASNLVRP